MRIIGGKFKGKKFSPPAKKWPTRPTTDFTREALMNILNNDYYLDDSKILDLFSGTGAISFEFISRGCTNVTCIEHFNPCIRFIKKITQELNIEDNIHIIQGDVFSFLKSSSEKFNIIFADPPYDLPTIDLIPDLVFEHELLDPEGTLIIEHGMNHTFSLHPHFIKEKKYGQTVLSFFENINE